MQHFQVQYEDYRVFLKKIHGPIETTLLIFCHYFLPSRILVEFELSLISSVKLTEAVHCVLPGSSNLLHAF
jgi:hypothetical protein